MSSLKIDFSKIKEELEGQNIITTEEAPKIKPPSRGKKKFFTCLVVFIMAIFVFYGVRALTTKNDGQNASFWTQLTHLVLSNNKELNGESDDRINILLLGIGGAGHDGPYLTDTIILASLQPKEKKVALLSIPRDLTMPIPGYGWRKINDADAFGEVANPGHGGELTVKTISAVFQIPIQYYVRVDFDGFKEFVDKLGGLKICVDNSFTDHLYPTDNFKTETISFTAGCQMMDGATALKYVRSRHGDNGEGSDFARNKRQQKVLLATKDKLLSFSTLTNPSLISDLYNQYISHVSTNLEVWEMLRLFELGKGITKDSIISTGLTAEITGGYLQEVRGDDGAALLQPWGGNYDDIRKLVANIFGTLPATPTINSTGTESANLNTKNTNINTTNTNTAPVTPVAPTPPKKTVAEKSKIEIRNGTFITGLASKIQADLVSLGYNVPTTGNTPFRDYEKTIIYDLSGGKYPQTLDFLASHLSATVSTAAPTWLKNITTNNIVVILGQEAGKLGL